MNRLRRANERQLRRVPLPSDQQEARADADAFSPGVSEGEASQQARRYTYERLLRVDLRNSYYNRSGGECPDFSAAPTPTTQSFMKALGLLFRYEGTGFSVLYDVNRRQQLLDMLERHRKEGVWTWLSFVLVPTNPLFVNLSDVPLDIHPTQRNFYFSNLDAHFEGQPALPTDQEVHCADAGDSVERRILLNPGSQVTGASLRSVVQVQVQVELEPGDQVDEVVVRDICGQEVLCKPCSIPLSLLAESAPSHISCQDVRQRRESDAKANVVEREVRAGRVVYLDFAVLPEGLYTLQQVSRDGTVLVEDVVLYTQAHPTPLGFVDLVLVKPPPEPPGSERTGIYPVCDLGRTPLLARIVPVEAELFFERRRTRWCYFIVPPTGVRYEELEIRDASQESPVRFSGPVQERLPNGALAWRFISDDLLPLQQTPTFRFELWGRRSQSPYPTLLMEALPTASPQQVLPREGPAPGTVRRTRPTGRAWRGPLPASTAGKTDYSDIYVYV